MAITLNGGGSITGLSSGAGISASALSGQVPDANAPSGSVIQVQYTTVTTTSEVALSSGGSFTTATVSITPTFSNSIIAFFHNSTFLYRGTSTSNNRLIILGRINGSDTATIKDWTCYSDATLVHGFRQDRDLSYFYVPNSTSTQTVGFKFVQSQGTPCIVGDNEIRYVWAMEIAP